MIVIRLNNRSWRYDPKQQVGPSGGFGSVFVGLSSNGEKVAVKRLHLDAADAAHRELGLAEELMKHELMNVMPVLDLGLDAESDTYFIVMPLAEKSLQEELERRGPISETECIQILIQIAVGLQEVFHLVHRDLKPGNVLLLGGVWRVADFGIARFIERATSSRTLKDCMTWEYAAPEQWTGDRTSNATDVYALGCIAHTLLNGSPPFPGPSEEDYCEQHCLAEPLRLEVSIPILGSLVTHMLRKAPEARPSLPRIVRVLQAARSQPTPSTCPGSTALAKADSLAQGELARQEAEIAKDVDQRNARERIAQDAYSTLADIAEHLFDRVAAIASGAVVEDQPVSVRTKLRKQNIVRLGLHGAQLSVNFVLDGQAVPEDAFQRSGWSVYAGAVIEVLQPQPHFRRSASLWFSDLGKETECRWFEVSYFSMAGPDPDPNHVPFGTMRFSQADVAAGPALAKINLAHTPLPIDLEDQSDFVERWLEVLGAAVQGKLERPRQLPFD